MAGRLDGRLALITGASRGIGAAIAERFAQEGAHVILTARTVGGLEETDDRVRVAGGSATLVPLDLLEQDKIDALGASIYQRFGKLDILVGNAGMLGNLSPVAHFDPKIWDRVMTVNATANYRLIRSLDRLLRASDAGRAVFTTSGVARSVVPYFGVYAASKAALEMTVRLYASETVKTRLRVNLVDPGVVRTALRAQGFPGEDREALPPPESVAPLFVDLAAPDCTRHGEIVAA